MSDTPFYDPDKSYEKNFDQGPFGVFQDGQVFERGGEPETEFLGHQVYLPFGIPAGPLVTGKFVKAAFDKGFDINVYKTVRTSARKSHQWPNIISVDVEGDLTLDQAAGELVASDKTTVPKSITNSFGVPSADPDWWQPDMKRTVETAGKGQIMIGSFQGTKKEEGGTAQDLINDYVLAAKLVKETGAKILEANLSCPNEGTADLLCFDTERVRLIADAIKQEIGNTPLILKTAYFESQEHLENFVLKVCPIADGLSTINTIPAKVVDKKGGQALPGAGRERSGICGPAIKWAGIEMVERLGKLRQAHNLDFAIVGVGGVASPADYHEYRTLGADAVMSATGAMWNPYLAKEIWESQSQE